MTTILVVDDNEQNLYLLQVLLQSHDYQVILAHNGAEALKIAGQAPPELIISDILMPELDGFALCREWKNDETLKTIPFIFYTATYTDPKDEELALSLGADRFILKPMEPEKFIALVESALEAYENGRLAAAPAVITKDPAYYRLYNEALVRKLEQKLVQLEQVNRNLEADIAKRIVIEAQLRDSEVSFRLLFASNPNPMWVYSLDTLAFLEVNQSATDLYGYSRAEFLQKRITDIRLPKDVPRLLKDVAQPRPKLQHSGEWQHQIKSGKIIDVAIVSHTLTFAGQPAALVVARNITQRKQAEAEIKRRNRELTLLNHIIAASAISHEVQPEDILTVACLELAQAFGLSHAVAGVFRQPNNTLEIVAEYRPETMVSLLGQTIPLLPDSDFQQLLAFRAPTAIENAQTDPRMAPVQHLTRPRHTVSLLIIPLVIDEKLMGAITLGSTQPHNFSPEELSLSGSVADQVAGVLARIRLYKEHQQLAEQYYQAQKMEAIGQLTAGIAHDFNNLLTAINGFSELLMMQLPPNISHQKMLNKIHFSGQRAASLVHQLLAFSRKQIIEPQIVDINTVVAQLDEMVQRIIGEHIQMVTKLNPELWAVKVDPSQLEQVILNLVVNARDAMPQGGSLIIETANVALDQYYSAGHLGAKPGDYVMLAVSDTGVGMSDEVKARVFEPFFTTKATGKGTGLGLATVYGIVKQSQGDIWVYSEQGRGTSFKIYLPGIGTVKPVSLPAPTAQEMPVGHETILLVEDNPEIRELINEVLLGQGYHVLTAQHGQDALQLAARHTGPIHLLITDIVMPGISGKLLADQLAQFWPELKMIFMSGYTDEAIVQHGELDPTLTFLRKPFSPIALAYKVRDVLG